ncbi:MFS transporter [Aurantiacibacter xanthus]|uniref:MFS transporter n=1 Tax=Aurantiacibacter xanthus TaxID=1784712 RepID=A0A3A1NY82_9SPHN|nr:MFS transporter [Aurantiacibacter xanthus]RIV80088.1 MFS transporter [Aurantiacibacter xanthus]
MTEAQASAGNARALFRVCLLAVLTAAMGFSIRTGVSGAIKAELLDPWMPMSSGEMIAATLGYSFLGFALSLLVISPFLDVIGAKKVVLFSSSSFIVGPLLILLSPMAGAGEAMYLMLNIGMIVCGLGWGAMEASTNPVTAAIYPEDKTGKLNALHAWWPFGVILGGLASVFLKDGMGLSWQLMIGLIMVPAVLCFVLTLPQTFPVTESTAKGVSFSAMIREPFRHASFWVFPAIMFLTASAELAPGSWVDVALTQTVGMPGILVLVYVSAIMFVMRHFAGPLERRFSDIGLLCMCCVPAAIGLYLLSLANSPVTALVAATAWAVGVCFMWPTMLAATSRRYPDSGPWGIGIVGFAGAMAIYAVLPKIGEIYDRAKLEKAGGAEAFAALLPGPELQEVLAFAAEKSFQAIAVVPVILFVIFGALWLVERRRRQRS